MVRLIEDKVSGTYHKVRFIVLGGSFLRSRTVRQGCKADFGFHVPMEYLRNFENVEYVQ